MNAQATAGTVSNSPQSSGPPAQPSASQAPQAGYSTEQPPAAYFPSATPPPKKRTGLIIGASAAAITIIIILIIAVGAQQSPFPAALDSCAVDTTYATLGDSDNTLVIDMEGEAEFGMTYDDVSCILDALNIPDSTLERMGQTSSLDGSVEDSWDGISASWTYHPDRGMDVILTRD
jgi:hypothetical protein